MPDLKYSQELALYFDMLRFHKHVTQESFTHGIISMRQYRRYLHGDSKIPQYVVNALSKKLGFKPEYLILEFEAAKFKENQYANDYHNAVINQDYEKACIIEKVFNDKSILDENNLMIYRFATALSKYQQKQLLAPAFVDTIKQLIDYPHILTHTVFSSTEIIILSALLSNHAFHEQDKIITIFNNYLNHKNTIVSGHNQKFILLILYHLSHYHKQYGDPQEMLRYAQKGISLCKKNKFNYLLEDFFRFAALACLRLNKKELINELLFRLYNVLQMEGNKAKINRYYRYIKNDFNIYDMDAFAISFIQQK